MTLLQTDVPRHYNIGFRQSNHCSIQAGFSNQWPQRDASSVAAVRVLPGIFEINELFPEIPVHDSGGDAFVVDWIGTGIGFRYVC